MTTTKKILNIIGCPHLNLYKGEGYWYFSYDDIEGKIYQTRSVYSLLLKSLSVAEWVEEGKSLVEEITNK